MKLRQIGHGKMIAAQVESASRSAKALKRKKNGEIKRIVTSVERMTAIEPTTRTKNAEERKVVVMTTVVAGAVETRRMDREIESRSDAIVKKDDERMVNL